MNESKSHLNKFSSVQRHKIVNDQKPSHDRSGLGFGKHVSDKSNVTSTSKITFVKPKMKEVENESMFVPKDVSMDRNRTFKSKFKIPRKRV